MRAKSVRPLSILLTLVLCALPLSAAPAADGPDAPAAPSWTARVLDGVSGWLTALLPTFGADDEAGVERVTAADEWFDLGGDPGGATTSCATCGEEGGDPGDDNGGPDWDPNG